MKRKIIEINEELCDGCGICAEACHEGAIQMVAGKAKLVSDIYCDGLGDCIGECPQGAITIIEREAEAYDEKAVTAKMHQNISEEKLPCGCPSSNVMDLQKGTEQSCCGGDSIEPEAISSRLRNWPVQIHLVPPHAPWLKGADIVLAADCVPFAYADFHRRFLETGPVLIGCPKLDDAKFYIDKIAEMLKVAEPKSITVVRMEVPCCGGMSQIAKHAISNSGMGIPAKEVIVGIRGDIISKRNLI